jgi:hypothetical protein
LKIFIVSPAVGGPLLLINIQEFVNKCALLDNSLKTKLQDALNTVTRTHMPTLQQEDASYNVQLCMSCLNLTRLGHVCLHVPKDTTLMTLQESACDCANKLGCIHTS